MFTVKEIHADFDTAQDRIVAEAERIINSPRQEIIFKANILNALGFTSVEAAVIGRNFEGNVRQQKELLGLVESYQQRYPFNQFITEKEVERLCKKYGLVFGPADRFTGDIPEKNLDEIANFKLLEEDMENEYSHSDWHIQSHGIGHFIRNHMGVFIEGEWMEESMERFNETRHFRKSKPAFKMVASYQDFDTSNMRLEGYKLEENLPDPIVLQPVKGGYLVVSKWGDEASDEIVLNEKMN